MSEFLLIEYISKLIRIYTLFSYKIWTLLKNMYIILYIDKYRYERRRKMDNQYVESAKVFKAFCDENRLRILEILQSGEKCACVLLEDLQISQSTLSHHMKILVDSGVVLARKDGKWTHYTISEEGCERAMKLLEGLTTL